jgi:hypothetical protein
MFSTEFPNSLHGATKGPTSGTLVGYDVPLFTGMEGPEAATKLGISIKLTLGRMNAVEFLTTKLEDILDDTPKPDDGATLYQIYTLQRSIKTEWTKAYWTVRGFFKPNSPAFDRLKQFDETCDLPELWKTFNSIYVASANFSGFLKLYDQLHGLKYVDKNLLSEFNRLNELQRRIVQLQDDPREVTTNTPQKATFSTPSPPVNRLLDLATTKEKESSTSTPSTSTTPDKPEGGAIIDLSSIKTLKESSKKRRNQEESLQHYFKCEIKRNMETPYKNLLQMYSYATKSKDQFF